MTRREKTLLGVGAGLLAILLLRRAGGPALPATVRLRWPFGDPKVPITSAFGMRWHPTRGGFRQHDGTDFGAREGTPVRAPAAGTVLKRVHGDPRAGNYLVLAHAENLTTSYLHLMSISPWATEGASVQAGDEIGKVGRTGDVTGPHLHMAAKVGGEYVDPMALMAAS